MISDPRALQYIFQQSGYRFVRTSEEKLRGTNLTGPGIANMSGQWCVGHSIETSLTFNQGEVHQRQRKVMLPAFSAQQLRTFLEVFQYHVGKVRPSSSQLAGSL
jgi:cytochrome P450